MAGSLIGIAGLGVMWWLHQDAKRYAYAIGQVVTHPRLAIMRQQARDEVDDAKGELIVAVLLFLMVVALTAAGFAALLGQGMVALSFLVAGELLSVVSLGALVLLGFMKMRRRNSIRSAVRLNKEAR